MNKRECPGKKGRMAILDVHNLELKKHYYHVRIEMRTSRIATFPQISFFMYMESVQARI